MAMNPMQRKANNYLLIGIFSTLIVTGAIIAFLFMQLKNLKDENARIEKAKVSVQVLSEDLKSGESIMDGTGEEATPKLVSKKVDASIVPENALKPEQLSEYTDKKITKIELKKGTIVTDEMFTDSENETTADLRRQEYNMIIVPSQIESGDYIDVRLMLSTGVDFIVASKKQVTIPEVDGVPSSTTISLNMDESETLVMANAIVEAYIDEGSILYATTYVEPGLQKSATPTYVPSVTVQNQMNANPNITREAKNSLFERYNSNLSTRTNVIDQTLAQYNQERVDNIESKVQEQITKAKQEREKYLQSLGGY